MPLGMHQSLWVAVTPVVRMAARNGVVRWNASQPDEKRRNFPSTAFQVPARAPNRSCMIAHGQDEVARAVLHQPGPIVRCATGYQDRNNKCRSRPEAVGALVIERRSTTEVVGNSCSART